MLVPRHLIMIVRALQSPDRDTEEQIPMYRLDPEEDSDE
jgi:hypothetical protein